MTREVKTTRDLVGTIAGGGVIMGRGLVLEANGGDSLGAVTAASMVGGGADTIAGGVVEGGVV